MTATPEQLRGELLYLIWRRGPVDAGLLLDHTYRASFTLVDVVNHLAALSQAGLILADEEASLFLPGMDEDAARREYARLSGVQACRACGCSDNWACDGGCEWVEPDLCSSCAETREAGV